mmetsp:Transcript_28872/g.37942  ORF Transcript_28872/g.37942 Transcript_28872/m.37942 type:complete len:296 (+) Transcript_28872:174-1061(+)|eukprot:CAMPEP_0117738896 /NCGR_PEP_ID=MMETSP0947-20121206/3411_1 /TAXON_ID=44440 /ORGANISM="Chattonella subsalsa, Strain CCMP2191" /LENGTH=295 /DNA_ID=CAMNT_0005554691 /DNA_START=315 /DNA_END=1202 /DNA_ORIENTATION=-
MNALYENQEKAKKLREEIASNEEQYKKEAEKNRNRVEYVRELQYSKGERIFAEQYRGFHKCGKDGDLSGLRYYLERMRVDINLQDTQGDTAFHHAAAKGRLPAIQWLFEDAMESILPEDAEDKDRERFQIKINFLNKRGFTALHSAAAYGHYETVEYLYQKGFDPKAQDIQGMTPAHWAAAGDHPKVLETLHKCQELPMTLENLSTPSNQGMTPAHSAATQNSLLALAFLAEAGCDLNAQDMNGDTPAHFAARMNWSEAVDVLRENNADFEIMNSDDDTAEELLADKMRHTLLWG